MHLRDVRQRKQETAIGPELRVPNREGKYVIVARSCPRHLAATGDGARRANTRSERRRLQVQWLAARASWTQTRRCQWNTGFVEQGRVRVIAGFSLGTPAAAFARASALGDANPR